ncbi:MAG: hypothetical protein QOG03_429, partial [Actinomycetota bacterium]|nr:hypothetical protein [Actinomycetota bacterium]
RLRSRWRSAGWAPVAVISITALVGFLLVSQLRGTQRFRQRLSAENEGDLTRILASLTTEADALRDQIGTLKLQLQTLQTSSQQDVVASQATADELRALQVLSGAVAVTGPGLVLTVEDPSRGVKYDTLIDVVQELRDAGAEAIGINGHRVGVASWLSQRDGKVVLDGENLNAPYQVTAIGDGTTLEGGLRIPGGAIDALTAIKAVKIAVERSANVVVPGLAKAPVFRAAHPVGSSP